LLITKLLFERCWKPIAQQKLEAQLRFEEMIGEISNFLSLSTWSESVKMTSAMLQQQKKCSGVDQCYRKSGKKSQGS